MWDSEEIVAVEGWEGLLVGWGSGGVVGCLDGLVEHREGGFVDGFKTLSDVHLPCGGCPSESVFDDVFAEVGGDEDEACCHSDRVSADSLEVGLVEV